MSKQEKSYDEKRAETRFPINSVAKITIIKTEKVISGTCRNISGSGMLICTQKKIAPDTAIKIEIATVVRVVEDDSNETLIAVKITKQY